MIRTDSSRWGKSDRENGYQSGELTDWNTYVLRVLVPIRQALNTRVEMINLESFPREQT